MEKKEFNISINAPREKVWNILWSKNTYGAWTAPFSEGSRAETDNWKKGSKVLFLDAKDDGMVSTVVENIPNEYMSFKHIGMVKAGVEDLTNPEIKNWAGFENYTLKSVNDQTQLIIDMDMNDEYKDYFEETWPKALDKIKELAEK